MDRPKVSTSGGHSVVVGSFCVCVCVLGVNVDANVVADVGIVDEFDVVVLLLLDVSISKAFFARFVRFFHDAADVQRRHLFLHRSLSQHQSK